VRARADTFGEGHVRPIRIQFAQPLTKLLDGMTSDVLQPRRAEKSLAITVHFIRRELRNRYLGSISGGLWALL